MSVLSRLTTQRSRAVSFCFDDGFLRTSEYVASLFSTNGVHACFCVLAAPLETADPYIQAAETGSWGYWRTLQSLGHEIAPHGWAHEKLFELPFADSVASIRQTWDVFAQELPGFDPLQSVFHPAYLRVPDDLLVWLSANALAVRLAGQQGVNNLRMLQRGGVVNCVCFGPNFIDASMRQRILEFIRGEGDWLVLVFHGVGNEGWGPISRTALGDLVKCVLDAGIRIETPNRLLQSRALKH